MTETTHREIVEPAAKKPEKKEDWKSFLWFCVKLALIVAIFRSFIFTSFNIPSESMMPRLLVGDYLFAQKWSYGYSNRSLPFNLPLLPESRLLASSPEPGDIVIFEHPVDGTDYIKRVIGLPGDEIQVIDGVLHINRQPVGHERIEDFVLPTTVERGCGSGRSDFTVRTDEGFECRFPQFRETLPSGVSYNILDFGPSGFNSRWNVDADNTAPYIVPEGTFFAMGDNRDNSLDSRFPAAAGAGVGFVPQDNLVAQATFMYWSWGDGVRWSRIGRGIE